MPTSVGVLQLDSQTRPSVGGQVLAGIGSIVAGMLCLVTGVYGASWVVIGGTVGEGLGAHIAVRLLGALLVCTAASVIRAMKRGSVLRASVVNRGAFVVMVGGLYVVAVPK